MPTAATILAQLWLSAFPILTLVPQNQTTCPFTGTDQCATACTTQTDYACRSQCVGLSGAARVSCDNACAAQEAGCDAWCFANC